MLDPDASEELLKGISGRFAMQVSQMLSSYQSKYKIKEIVNYPSFRPFLNLLKRMTEPISTERTSPIDAYKLYKKCMRSKKTIKK